MTGSMADPENYAGVGLTIQPVYGARAFKVTDAGWLTGIVYGQVWGLGENVAVCRKDDGTVTTYYPEPVPAPVLPPPPPVAHELNDHCRCGLYAFYDGSNDYHKVNHGVERVAGVIKGSGKTLIGTRGFRTSKAQIVALCVTSLVDEELADRVRANYWSIPFYPSFAEMVELWPPDKGEN